MLAFKTIDKVLTGLSLVFAALLVFGGTQMSTIDAEYILSDTANRPSGRYSTEPQKLVDAHRATPHPRAIAIGGITYIENVPLISQHPYWPTGCEIVAIAKLTAFYGVEKSVDEWIRLMPKGPIVWRNGRMYAPDPRDKFVGCPYSPDSYGVYHQPLIALLQPIFGDDVINMTGRPWAEYEALVRAGHPVAVWGTISNLPIRRTDSWVTPRGEIFRWRGNAHVMVLVGFSETSVLVNDPWTGTLRRFDREVFIQRWRELGYQGIALANVTP